MVKISQLSPNAARRVRRRVRRRWWLRRVLTALWPRDDRDRDPGGEQQPQRQAA